MVFFVEFCEEDTDQLTQFCKPTTASKPCGSITVFGFGKSDALLSDPKIETQQALPGTALRKYSIGFGIYVGLNSWEHLTKRIAQLESLDTSLIISPQTVDSRYVSF